MNCEVATAEMTDQAAGLSHSTNSVAAAALGERQALMIMAVVCATVFFTVLNTTMFNVTIPDISREFGLSPATVSWVLTAYVAIFGLGAVTYGKIADYLPIKRLIYVALVLFNSGCLIGFCSRWFPLLIAGRMIQAVGGSAMTALGMYVSVRVVPLQMRGRFLGAVAATIACAGGFGPVFGGFIAGHFHWRYLFLLSMVTLLSLPLYARLLPDEVRRPGRFDFLGCLLLGGSVACTLFFLAQAVVWALPLGLLFMAVFVIRINSTADPFIQPGLLKIRQYRNGLLTLFFSLGTVHGMMFTLPLMLRNINHLDTRAIGLVIFPAAMTAALLSFFCGRLADRKGSVPVVYIGLAFFLVGFALLVLLAGNSPLLVTMGLLVSYSGFSIVQSSLSRTVSMILPSNQTGIGMGMYNLVFFLAGGVGAAIASRIIEGCSHSLATTGPFAGALPYRMVFLLFFCMEVAACVIFYRNFSVADANQSAF